MRSKRGCRAVESGEIAGGFDFFKKCSHNGGDFLLAEVELLLFLKIEIYRHFKLLSLDDREEHIRLLPCLVLIHCIGIPVRTDRNADRLSAGIILLKTLVLLRSKSAVACADNRKNDAVSLDLLPVDITVVNAHIDTFHSISLFVLIRSISGKILVKIIGHRAVAVNFIAVPLTIRADIHMRVDICGGNVGNASEADILRFLTDDF